MTDCAKAGTPGFCCWIHDQLKECTGESLSASQWLDFDFPLSNLSSAFKTIDPYLDSVSDSKASSLGMGRLVV